MATKRDAWRTRLTSVIAEREYQLAHKGRRKTKVLLRIGKPRVEPGGEDYYCVFRYEGLGDADRTGYAMGIDGIQAFQLAVQVALTHLLCSTAYEEGRLTWEGSYDLALGFPVSDAVKDRVRKDALRRRSTARKPTSKRRARRE